MIPILSVKRLKLIAERYWIIEICPNLSCKLLNPIIILDSFNICTNGMWYNPASGLNSVSYNINKKHTKEDWNKKNKSFFDKLTFLIIKIIMIKNITEEFTIMFNGKKKLINREIKQKNISPKIELSIVFGFLYLKKNLYVKFPNII